MINQKDATLKLAYWHERKFRIIGIHRLLSKNNQSVLLGLHFYCRGKTALGYIFEHKIPINEDLIPGMEISAKLQISRNPGSWRFIIREINGIAVA